MAEKFLNLAGLNTLWGKIKKLLPYWVSSRFLDIDCSSLTVDNFLNKEDGLFSFIPWTTDVDSTSFGVGRVKNLSSEVASNFSIANFSMIRWWQARDFWEIEIVAKAINKRHRICYQSASSTVGVIYYLHNANSIISGTLPIERGGTGATTRYEAEYNLLGESGTAETTITDERLFALRNQTVSASNGAMRWIKCSVIWTYIQNKISSILGLTASVYNGTAAKAIADANGANIADTYATKTALSDEAVARSETDETLQANIDSVVANLTSETTARENADADLQTALNAKASIESVNSLGQSVSALTNSVNGKLDLNGSNASSTTTYNVLNSAAGGGSVDFSNDEEIITTYPTGQVAYKRTLEKFGDWVLGIVNRKLNSWFGNEQEVVFNDVKVRQGIDSAEVQVATYYGISQSYYDKEYIDDEVSALNESVDSKIGFEEVKNITNSGMATNAATSSLPVTIFYAGSGGSIASIYKAYVANAQEPLFLTCGRCIYLVNTTASNVTITGLTKGNYTLDAGRAMTIIYYTGTSGEFWYSPDVNE